MAANIKSKINGLTWSQWLGILGLAALFVGLRWNSYDAPLDRDEGEYAYSAQLLIHGLAPYQHAFVQKPPAVFYTYVLSNLLLPAAFWSPRLLASGFIALATVLLGFIARLEFGGASALPVMWLATPMILLPGLDQTDANVEMFMLLPLVATVAVYCYARQHDHKNKYWLMAGFLAATTLLYKYTALPVLAFVFAAWLVETWRQARNLKIIFAALACGAAGGILASGLGLGYFLLHDGGKHFLECTVLYNRYYASSSDFSLGYFAGEAKVLWRSWWILFLIPWAIFLQPRPRVLFWLGIFLCAVLATNGSCYGHYYMVIMPFWAMLCALGIIALASRISGWLGGLSASATCLITIVTMALVLRPDAMWMFTSRQKFVEIKTQGFPFIDALAVASQVLQRSLPDDSVYVAGSEPEILCYGQRFSPTRFITSYSLMFPTPLARGYQGEAINDLRQHPPKLIVFVQSGYSWLRQSETPPEFLDFLEKLLKQDYQLVGAYVKPDVQHGYWTEKLSRDEFMNSSLWLYEHKPIQSDNVTNMSAPLPSTKVVPIVRVGEDRPVSDNFHSQHQ